jgi:hypothetical protein
MTITKLINSEKVTYNLNVVREGIIFDDTCQGYSFYVFEKEYDFFTKIFFIEGYVNIPKDNEYWQKRADDLPIWFEHHAIITMEKNSDWFIGKDVHNFYSPGPISNNKYVLADAILDSHTIIMKLLESESIYSNYDRCLAAVREDGMNLKFVKHELQTEELCYEAVSRESYALRFVKHELKSPKLCIMAVEQEYRAICYVPPQYRNFVKQKLDII